MKGFVKQTPKRVARTASHASPKAARRAPTRQPPSGNRARWSSAHRAAETQADAAAARSLAGDHDVGRTLAPSPVARASVAGSPGTPLQPSIRGPLERSFGADLTAVRIHTDSAAAEAVAAIGARAFTAGRDVYLGRSARDLDSEMGRHVLSHEIAHVLQQTGRRGDDGALRATALDGSGAVQCAPEAVLDSFEDGFFADAFIDLPIIAAHYREEFGKTEKDIEDAIKTVETALGKNLRPRPDQAKIDALKKSLLGIGEPDKTKVAAARKAFDALPERVRSLYMDVFKALGEFSTAELIFDRGGKDLRTSFLSRKFYLHVRGTTLDWMFDVLRRKQRATKPARLLLGTYFDVNWVATFPPFLLSPTAKWMYDLDIAAGKFQEKAEKALEDSGTGQKGLKENELYVVTVKTLERLDEKRKHWLPDLARKVLENDPRLTRLDIKMRLARLLVGQADFKDWETSSESDFEPTFSVEELKLLSHWRPKVLAQAQKVLDFWEALEGQVQYAPVEETYAALRADKRLKPFEAHLAEMARKLFQEKAGASRYDFLPKPDTYALLVENAIHGLRMHVHNKYEVPLIQLSFQGKLDKTEAYNLGWVIRAGDFLDRALRRYDKAADKAFKTVTIKEGPKGKEKDVEKRLADHRIGHRLRVAYVLNQIAYALDQKKVQAAIAKVLSPVDTQLALDGAWVKSPDVRLGDMSRELGAGTVPDAFAHTKLTFGLMERFLYSDYYRALTKKLEELLAARKGVYSDKVNPILTDAVRAVESWPKPERWIMPESEVVRGSKPTATLRGLILAHPKADEIFAGRSGFFLATDESTVTHRHGVVVWALPRMDEMVKMLRTPALDAVVRAEWTVVFKDAAEMPETPAPGDWLKVVEALAAKGTIVDGKTIDAIIRELITTDYQKALKGDPTNPDPQLRAGLEDAARRATSHQRRVHEETRIIPRWRAYDRGEIATMFEPREAVRWMLDFTSFISPDEDRPAQLAALVIEVAPEMEEPMDNDLRDIPIPHLLPLLSGTVRVMDETKDPRFAQRVWAIKRDDMNVEQYNKNIKRVRDYEKTLKAWVKEHQFEFGLIGEAGSQTLRAVGETYHFKAGFDHSFVFEGVRYQLVKVHKSFRWHTDYPMGLAAGVAWPGEDASGQAFLVDENKQQVKPTGDLLFTIKIGEVFYDVKDTDTHRLGQVQHAAAMYSILKGLKVLAKAIDKFGNALLRAAEWFPATAVPARVARIAATVIETLGSDDFKELLDALSKDGVEGIKKYVDKAVEFFNPPSPVDVVTWILFDNADRKFDMGTKASDRQRRVGGRKGIWSAVAAMARNILRLGERMLGRMQKLRVHAQAPIRRSRLFVISHPGAALIVRYIMLNYERLPSLDLKELLGGGGMAASKAADWKKTAEEGINQGANGLLERGAEILNTLSHLELPHELVNVEKVVDFAITLIFSRLPTEYQIAFEGMKAILEELDVWQDGLVEIADALKAGGVDPNVLWRDLIRDKINGALIDVRDAFVKALKDKLAEVPFLRPMLKDPEAGSTALEAQTEGSGFPEVEDQPDDMTDLFAAPDGGGEPSVDEIAATPPKPSSFSSGAPLSPSARAGAEIRLGHDLSHVRVHAGADAAAMTSAYRAEGVTTGSHVFLRPGLSTSSDFGSRVLGHELAHVVQQTGPRPLGGTHSATPSRGEPGAGLNVDPGREAAADRAFAGPGSFGALDAGGARGVQPFGSDFFRRFLREMTTTQTMHDEMVKIDKEGAGSLLAHELAEDQAAKDLIKALSETGTDSLVKAIKGMTHDHFTTEPFKQPDIAKAIVKYISDNAAKDIEKVIARLVYRARAELTTKKGKDGPVKAFHYVPPHRLEQEVADYLFAKTGVAIKVEFNEEKGKDELKRKDVVKVSKPIKSIKAGYLHLPFIGGTAALWDAVIENTFKTSPTIKTKFATTPKAVAEYKAGARLVLSRLGPRPGTYDKKAKVLKFSDTIATAIESEVHPPADLPADKLPSVADYVSTNKYGDPVVSTDTTYGNMGLRLGLYDEHGPVKGKGGFEREAHHTTQFLLLEYFQNMHKTNTPFPVKKGIASGLYPGVDGDATGVKTIKKPGATDGIKVADYFVRRGGLMPTILISRHTHHSDVHIHAEPDEAEGTSSKSTQAQAVDNNFYKSLGSSAGPWRAFFKDETQLKALKAKPTDKIAVGSENVTAEDVGKKIFVAASKTYQWMVNEMRDKLHLGLKNAEVEYYNAIAEIGGKPKITSGDMEKPFKHSVKWNKEQMELGGAGFDPTA